jgi:hypothetical protein
MRQISPYYRRTEQEGRTLIQSALRRASRPAALRFLLRRPLRQGPFASSRSGCAAAAVEGERMPTLLVLAVCVALLGSPIAAAPAVEDFSVRIDRPYSPFGPARGS